jgi:hypothetical protein
MKPGPDTKTHKRPAQEREKRDARQDIGRKTQRRRKRRDRRQDKTQDNNTKANASHKTITRTTKVTREQNNIYVKSRAEQNKRREKHDTHTQNTR